MLSQKMAKINVKIGIIRDYSLEINGNIGINYRLLSEISLISVLLISLGSYQTIILAISVWREYIFPYKLLAASGPQVVG